MQNFNIRETVLGAPRGKAETKSISAAEIEATLRLFYGGVRDDDVIGPVFRRVIAEEDWDTHVARIGAFWRKVLLDEPGFDGRPMQKHVAIGELEQHHFERWLALFEKACRSECSPGSAEIWIARAQLIGASLLRGVALHKLPRRRDGHELH